MTDSHHGARAGSTVGDPRLAEIAIRAARLEVTEGPDAGMVARVASPVFVIGTGELADLRLTDPTVSREHLRLHVSDAGLVLRDEGSRNGTWLGGLRIHHAAIASDVRVKLGSTAITISVDNEVSAVPVSASGRFGDAIGGSTAMRLVFALLQRAAPTELTVLLEGESGVGKEVLARSIHTQSARRGGPFVAVDCGAIPPQLLESELFGHLRGSFTGANADRGGLFSEADGGTLFLDEIGELPLDMQPKLLRALEQREVRPVGANKPRPIDVRIVAATNRQLAAAVARGEFREDLLYRLSVVRVNVPPLRDRRDDILSLARSFLVTATSDKDAQLPPDIEGMLLAYAWPGNVRELRNCVQRFAALGVRDRASLLATSAAEAPAFLDEKLSDLPYHEARQQIVEQFERAYVDGVLEKCDGVVVKAAEHAGIGRASFYRMLERLKPRK
ncbi:MAG TPA: sigma 54-interacting transcriptional regulator [Labilithrix sp.]|nr:sigma 54-interacting transcriptional regulator [Labilithrix sp.]